MSTENQTPETQTLESQSDDLGEAVERAVGTLFGLGRLWAAHGLNMGRAVLETSAVTLRTTAELLGEVSERFAGDAAVVTPEADAPEAA